MVAPPQVAGLVGILMTPQVAASPSRRGRHRRAQNSDSLSDHFRRHSATVRPLLSDDSLDGTSNKSETTTKGLTFSRSRGSRTSTGRVSSVSTCTSEAATDGRRKPRRKIKLPKNPERKPKRRSGLTKKQDDGDAQETTGAGAQLKSVAEQARSSIECPICLECYDETAGRVPCTLRCGHSFCMAHLTKIKTCPICRIALPKNLKAVKKSVVLCEAARAINSMIGTIETLEAS